MCEIEPSYEAHPVSYSVVTGHLLTGVEGTKLEADLPHDFSAKMKNLWIFTTTSSPPFFRCFAPQHLGSFVSKVKTIPEGSRRLRLPDFNTIGP